MKCSLRNAKNTDLTFLVLETDTEGLWFTQGQSANSRAGDDW